MMIESGASQNNVTAPLFTLIRSIFILNFGDTSWIRTQIYQQNMLLNLRS